MKTDVSAIYAFG